MQRPRRLSLIVSVRMTSALSVRPLAGDDFAFGGSRLTHRRRLWFSWCFVNPSSNRDRRRAPAKERRSEAGLKPAAPHEQTPSTALLRKLVGPEPLDGWKLTRSSSRRPHRLREREGVLPG